MSDELNPLDKALLEIVDRKKVLLNAIEAVEAGAELKLIESKTVLNVTRSKHVRPWPDGDYHYPDNPDYEPYILGGILIPRAVHLAAIRVERNPTVAAERKTRGPVHDYKLFDSIADTMAEQLWHDKRGEKNPLRTLRSKTRDRYNKKRRDQGKPQMQEQLSPRGREKIREIKQKYGSE